MYRIKRLVDKYECLLEQCLMDKNLGMCHVGPRVPTTWQQEGRQRGRHGLNRRRGALGAAVARSRRRGRLAAVSAI